MKKNDQDFPYSKGTHFTYNTTNQYDADARLSEPFKKQFDLEWELELCAEQAYDFSEASSRKPLDKKELKAKTVLEAEYEDRKNFMACLNIKFNDLRYATKSKVYLNYFIVFISMIAEYFVYQSIGDNYFSLGEKSYAFGAIVLGFTKVLSLIFKRYIKDWFRQKNIYKRNSKSIIAFGLVILIIINACMLGIINLHQVKQNAAIQQMAMYSAAISEAELNGEDTTHLEEELAGIEAELNKKPNLLTRIAIVTGIGLLGLLTVLTGAILFVVAELYRDALNLKRKIKSLKNEQNILQANVPNYVKAYGEFLTLHKELIMLYAKKEYLERLISKLYQE